MTNASDRVPEDIRKLERVQLAYHLHDGPARRLVECLHRLELCERTMGPDQGQVLTEMHAVTAAVRRSLDEMRGIISQYRNGPEDLDLREGLLTIVQEFQTLSSIEVSLEIPERAVQMPSQQVAALYAVVEEALFNTWRHAAPTHIRVRVEVGMDIIEVVVSDDGRGFLPERYWQGHTNGDGGASVGLLGLRERVEACGGDFTLKSQPGSGTVVMARFSLGHSTTSKADY